MMKRFQLCKKSRYLGWIVILLLPVFQVNAHEIHLKSGKIIKTTSVQEKDGLIVYEKKGGIVSISKELVREIIYTQPSQVPTTLKKASGPVVYYPFDGNADDRLNPQNNGIVYGARLVADRFERLKSSYRFDGVDDYIQVNTPVLPKPPFSVSFWFNAYTITPEGQYLLSNGGQAGSLPGFYCKLVGKKETVHGRSSWPKSGIQCGVHAAEQNFSITVTRESLILTEWHHILLAWDGIPADNHVFLYIDGKSASEFTERRTVEIFDHPNILRVGAPNDNVSARLFKGIIDEIRFYNRVLSSGEIQQLGQYAPRYTE